MADRLPNDVVFWQLPKHDSIQLKQDAQADVVVIGGGMAGLSAAQKFHEKGLSVIVLEKNFCGAGASGKSSGFITPDSEYSLSMFTEKYGAEKAKIIWEFVISGVDLIRNNITSYEIDCEHSKQDTLVIAHTQKAFSSEIVQEHSTRRSLGYDSSLYNQSELPSILGTDQFFGGVRYSKTFGINGYRYLQEMKDRLSKQGVQIYEESPVLNFDNNTVYCSGAKVKAQYIVVCADWWIPEFGKLFYDLYHAQTFLLLSAPLKDNEVQALFPQGPLMVWDTSLIYTYFRITPDNRLLLGGSNIYQTYASKAHHDNETIFHKLTSYFYKKFPHIKPEFHYMWPGLIGVSKDILPLAGKDDQNPNIYYVGAAAGLPWASALGAYSADSLIDGRSEFDDLFSPYRPFTVNSTIQKCIGTRLAFALSHMSVNRKFFSIT